MRKWWVLMVLLAACPSPSPSPAPKSSGCDFHLSHISPGWGNPGYFPERDLAVQLGDLRPPSLCLPDTMCYAIGDTCEVDSDAEVIQCACVPSTPGAPVWWCQSVDAGPALSADASASD